MFGALINNSPTYAASQSQNNSNIFVPQGVIIHRPPAGFNPLTASTQSLQQFGFPERPSNPQQQILWKKAVEGSHWVYPTFRKSNFKTVLLTAANHWSGMIYNSNASRVVGWWNQPFAYAPTAYQPAYSADWVGLGGINGTPLIQGGTFSNVKSGGGEQYNAFYEIVGTSANTGNNSVFIQGLNNQPGDQIYCDIWFTTTSGIGTANFYYHDLTNNNATSFSIGNITNYGNVTANAEWITERPEEPPATYPNMDNYGSVNWTAEVGTPSNVSYPSYLDVYYLECEQNIPNKNYTVLSTVSSFLNSTGNFSTSWENYN